MARDAIDEREIEEFLKGYRSWDPLSRASQAEIRRRVGAHPRLVAALREIARGVERDNYGAAKVIAIANEALLGLGGGAQGECDEGFWCRGCGQQKVSGNGLCEECVSRLSRLAQGEAGKEATNDR